MIKRKSELTEVVRKEKWHGKIVKILENEELQENCRLFAKITVEPAADSHDNEKIRLRELENEVKQLRKEKADLEDTVEILKKASDIFSQSQRKSTR